jgi:Ca-activated chloride channel homolog
MTSHGSKASNLKFALTLTTAIGSVLLVAACSSEPLFGPDDQKEVAQEAPPPAEQPAATGTAKPSAHPMKMEGRWRDQDVVNTEKYPDAKPNPVKVVKDEPVSTFSVDVDTASYGNVRRHLNEGRLPPTDAIRIEEMINYFEYAYALPENKAQPFAPTVKVYDTPWNPDTQLIHIGIKGYDIVPNQRPKANLVFLVDVSGSMQDENKLPLVKRSLRMLVEQLGDDDRISMVVYAGSAGMVLEPTSGADKQKILSKIDVLEAGGSTAGGEGIRQAYALAKQSFVKDGVNRVILASDGDFNVGITDPQALEDYVARERDSGVSLTILGFGGGNYNDLMMQKLAQAGNGNAAYIDTLNEARKVLVEEMSSTLFTIAKDVKLQVEFNPTQVAEYRLIGYETRLLDRTDFNNDKVDAGDIGSGHCVTALYEIVPVGSKARLTDPLRYGEPAQAIGSATSSEFALLRIRYKLPEETASKLIERPISRSDKTEFSGLPEDLRFAAAVAGFGQLLKSSPHMKNFNYDSVIEIAQDAKGRDEIGYRSEFIQLARAAKTSQGLPSQSSQNTTGQ